MCLTHSSRKLPLWLGMDLALWLRKLSRDWPLWLGYIIVLSHFATRLNFLHELTVPCVTKERRSTCISSIATSRMEDEATGVIVVLAASPQHGQSEVRQHLPRPTGGLILGAYGSLARRHGPVEQPTA